MIIAKWCIPQGVRAISGKGSQLHFVILNHSMCGQSRRRREAFVTDWQPWESKNPNRYCAHCIAAIKKFKLDVPYPIAMAAY